jgi:predicted protein tyrosine phosphatase
VETRNGTRKLLFVCSRNQRRSITAERLYNGFPGYAVKSAGTDHGSRVRVKQEHIEWADLIFVMETRHVTELRRHFKRALQGKRLICLQIPERYGCMTIELMDALREKLSLYIDVPK